MSLRGIWEGRAVTHQARPFVSVLTRKAVAAGALARERLSPVERRFRTIWPAIDSIEGYLISPAQERWLFRAALALLDGAAIVEIGSYKGRSTCCLAFGCLRSHKRVYAVDTFDGNSRDFFERDFFPEFQCNLERCGVSEYVVPLKGTSRDVGRAWSRPINLLFIDGSHVYEDVVEDFTLFFSHLVPGGVLAVHDVIPTWPGPLAAWNGVIRPCLKDVGYCHSLAYGVKP